MKTATATSIGSAMQLAYAYGGRAPVFLSDADETKAQHAGQALRVPAYATSVVYASATAYTVRPIHAGRIAEPSVIIHLAGDALADISV